MTTYNTLENIQNINEIVKVFSNGKHEEQFQCTPHLIVLVGAPGVGKTSQAKRIIQETTGLQYDNFYNVSLDSLVEKIKPYRNTTRNLYRTIKNKKKDLTNENINPIANIYLPTITSKKKNLGLGQSRRRALSKITGESFVPDKTKETILYTSLPYRSLIELRELGFIYAVKKGFNIIYDTTLRPDKNIIKENILRILEKESNIKYKVYVILVNAPVEQIKKQLRKRHSEMIKDEYIRAVRLELTEKYVRENKEGFEIAKEYFKESHSNSNYTPKDFEFIEVNNKNMNNISNRRNIIGRYRINL
jgi:GTPase SAR1 family protein